MLCKLNSDLVEMRGTDVLEKNGLWRTSYLKESEIYFIYAIGKNKLFDDCELLIASEEDRLPSWHKASVFEIIEDAIPLEWIIRLNFEDINELGDTAAWSLLMGWPEMFEPGRLIGLINRDLVEIEKFGDVENKLRRLKS